MHIYCSAICTFIHSYVLPSILHTNYTGYLPVVKRWETEGLALCVCPQVSLKPKWVDGRNESFYSIEWWPWYWSILSDVTPSKSTSMLNYNDNHTCVVWVDQMGLNVRTYFISVSSKGNTETVEYSSWLGSFNMPPHGVFLNTLAKLL